jgi:GntR family transcriptional regulator, arabinose operon transcriptional repressor
MSKKMIRQDSPEPIRSQLKDILLKEITDGSFHQGGRIPSERELAERFAISRASVRETITELINSGILFRTVGKGTFVASEARRPDIAVPSISFVISEEIFNFVQTGYNKILSGVQQVCRDRGTQLLFNSIGEEPSSSNNGRKMEAKQQLSGCIVVGGVRRHVIDRLHEEGIPTVLVDIILNDDTLDFPSVTIDYEAGARMAVKYLYENGHRKIGYIGFSGSQKYEGYWTSLEQLTLQYDPRQVEFLQLLDLQPGILAGYHAMQRIISRKRLPSAIVVTNDFVAIGVLEALGMSGIKVPDQMSIIGFDDLGLKPSPPLTTIRVNLTRVGEKAAEQLFRLIEGKAEDTKNTIIPVELTIRGTTAPLSSKAADQTVSIPTSS